MPPLILRLIASIRTPSGGADPLALSHHRAVTAGGHALLGAAVAGPFGLYGLGAATLAAAAYWLAKEWADLRRGGRVWDGAEDTVLVALGFWYGTPWWPAMILACMAWVMAMDARARG